MGKRISLFLASFFLANILLFAGNTPTTPTLTITTKRGKTFSITLDSNKTTGYSWQMQPLDTSLVTFIHAKYIKNKSRRAGARDKEMWTFKAVAPGSATISLHYLRPWENDVPPAHAITFTVIIQ